MKQLSKLSLFLLLIILATLLVACSDADLSAINAIIANWHWGDNRLSLHPCLHCKYDKGAGYYQCYYCLVEQQV